ncbi:unnamed protein product [Acanthocheilonema viteae]|uniref:Uncharacterized protein n=1 Tax=Acanthocheilonema viteae TaxID=6277 RepID=A0A498STX1_ACAVI|nr:unnamed protein product [Acanthocheilonema viteae]
MWDNRTQHSRYRCRGSNSALSPYRIRLLPLGSNAFLYSRMIGAEAGFWYSTTTEGRQWVIKYPRVTPSVTLPPHSGTGGEALYTDWVNECI